MSQKSESDMPSPADRVKVVSPVHNLFPIVGIGASAGGLEALEQFFMNMPANSGMAFIIIQHLDPNYKGMLRELLQRITKMPVQIATEKAKINPNNVYIIPPNKNLSITKDVLYLSDPVEERGLRLPIDFFFRSLAKDRLEKSIGIILSGMGSDGCIGVRAIKEVGGLVLIQDPALAKYDSMPRNAIDNVVVDTVSPASELPIRLSSILRHTPTKQAKPKQKYEITIVEKIVNLLREQTGNDFSQYKKSTISRRIDRRMGIHKIKKISDYVRLLQENPSEANILFKELLIGVTSFFRDLSAWEKLINNVLPEMFSKLSSRHVIRAWVPGCSTGEEAYSLAISFKEALEKNNSYKSFIFQIFATDLDVTAIEKARRGIYPANISEDVSPKRLHRFFVKVDDKYRVSSEIREMVVFANQNVLKDPPFTNLNFISCRNLMIYLESDTQKTLLSIFHYVLNSEGILLLGSAETPGQSNENFSVIDSKLRIYQKSGKMRNEKNGMSDSIFQNHNMRDKKNPQKPVENTQNLQNLTEQVLMQYFSPPGVLVLPDGEILFISGNTEKYISPAVGKATLNLFLMARESLKSVLHNAFRKALMGFDKVLLKDIKIEDGKSTFMADITLQQLERPSALKGKILVIFSESEIPEIDISPKKTSKKQLSKITELKKELQKVKEDLQSSDEEMQTSQEELKSSNEELQSTNEELQSTNEELMTSKEEMQSLNEELQTVNAELQMKINDLAKVNNDMTNLLNSFEVATLFLDKELRIRQFTIPVTKIFKLIQSDIGRVFTDQVTDLDYPAMHHDAMEVIRTLVFIEKPVPTLDGRWFNIRIMPYRTIEDKIDGLVITYIDITEKKHSEASLANSQKQFVALIRDIPYIIIRFTIDEKIIDFNPVAEKVFKVKKNIVLGSNFFELFILVEDMKSIRTRIAKISYKGKSLFESEVRLSNGDRVKIKWVTRKFKDEIDVFTMIGELNK